MDPPRCAVCGEVLGPHHLKNGHGERFCVRHRDGDSCVWCGRVRGLTLRMSVMRCTACDPKCIDRADQLEPIRRSVLSAYARHITGHLLAEVPVVIEGGMLVRRGSRRLGSAHCVVDDSIADVRIVMAPGLPRVLAGAVLAHEYGHVLFVTDPTTLRPWKRRRHVADDEEEGACEVLADAWLSGQAGQDAELERRRLRENPDPVYGDGYRKMAARRAASASTAEWLAADVFGERTSRVRASAKR